jgi:copper chaperone NosL
MDATHHSDTRRRYLVLALAAAAVALYAAAYFQPMWGWYLSAPQYPKGLVMSVYLDKVTGDVTEINILNHYIGMKKLDEAAQLERALAVYGVCGIGLVAMLMVFFPGKRYAKYFTVPAFLFPAVFLGMMYLWMYRFGHELSPEAPVTVLPFTPTLAGHGQIGNFHTLGLPGPGFYMILGAAAAVALAFTLRRKVCGGCAHADTCGLVCPHLFLGPRRTPPRSRLPIIQ